jgi:hypothetical protein
MHEPRLSATAIQAVGEKNYHRLVLAIADAATGDYGLDSG